MPSSVSSESSAESSSSPVIGLPPQRRSTSPLPARTTITSVEQLWLRKRAPGFRSIASWLLGQEARVDVESHASDVAGLVGGEEQGGVGDVDGFEPAGRQGVPALKDLSQLVGAGDAEEVVHRLVLDHVRV